MELTLPVSLIGWLLLAILVVITAVPAFAFKPVMNYVRAHVNSKMFELLRKWAYTNVAALMQDPTLKGLASEEKKQLAILWLMKKAEQFKISLTVEEASNLVEEAVYLLKSISLPELEDSLAPAG
jgi:hypothetical protein